MNENLTDPNLFPEKEQDQLLWSKCKIDTCLAPLASKFFYYECREWLTRSWQAEPLKSCTNKCHFWHFYCSWVPESDPDLIFVILSPQMYFLGSIFLHMKVRKLWQNLPKFPICSQNFSTWQFFLHKYNLWYLWQIWALSIDQLKQASVISLHASLLSLELVSMWTSTSKNVN